MAVKVLQEEKLKPEHRFRYVVQDEVEDIAVNLSVVLCKV